MKKLFIFATAAIAFASCSESDLGNIAQENTLEQATAVSFGTYMGESATRAGTTGSITTESLQTGGTHATDGFAVFAFNTGSSNWATAGSSTAPNFMYNQQVKYSGSTWTYDPIKYWPNGIDAANAENTPSNTATDGDTPKLSFFAYAPYVAATASNGVVTPAENGIIGLTANNVNGDPKVTYKFKSGSLKEADNVDLLWGLAGATGYSQANGTDISDLTVGTNYNVDITKTNTDEKIKFYFKHALAKIGGATSTTTSGLKVVADIDDNGSGLTGNGSVDPKTLITINSITIANGTSGSTSTVKGGGVFDIATGTWDLTTEASDPIEFSNVYKSDDETTSKNAVIWEPATSPTYNGGWPIAGVQTGTAQNVFSDVTDAIYVIPGAEQTLTVTVQYTVRTNDANLAAGKTEVVQTITNNVNIGALESNKAYTLVMHLGLTSIKFAAEVAQWNSNDGETPTETTPSVIWLPSNVVPTPVTQAP